MFDDLRQIRLTLVQSIDNIVIDAFTALTRVELSALGTSNAALHKSHAHASLIIPDLASLAFFFGSANFLAFVITEEIFLFDGNRLRNSEIR